MANQGPSAVPRTHTGGRLNAYLWPRRSGATWGNRPAAPASNNHCLAPEPGQPISVGTVDRRPDCVAAGLLVRFRSWQPPNPPESALRLPVHTFREPVGWLVPMLESNTCSCRSPRSGDARSRDAADRTLQKGCAVATTSNRDAGDRCNLYPSEFEVTPRAALGAAGTLPSTEDSARRTPTRERRASRYVPFGPSTACRVPADLMAAPNRVRPEASAQATPPSTTVAAGWLRSSNPRWDATFLAARNAISHSGTAKAIGGNSGRTGRLRLFAR